MAEGSAERVYEPEETEAHLRRDLPDWRLADGWIVRTYRTAGWKSTLMVVNAVGHLAEAAWHHPDLVVSYSSVEVRLRNHAAKGITDKDFELAAKLDSVVLWRPEGGALTGTPADPRFAYIKHDAPASTG
jgi:4a-hydroxytetrahydrobiopterin dehydratase